MCLSQRKADSDKEIPDIPQKGHFTLQKLRFRYAPLNFTFYRTKYSVINLHSRFIYGGERISTGNPSLDKRAEVRHLYKSFKVIK